MRKGQATRQRILDIAEASVLAKGFGGTSIDEIIAEAGITRSGFFYHFRDKNELARAMIQRYIETHDRLLDRLFGRAAELSDDPLQAFLIGIKLFAETVRDLPNGHPGCLIASICYQERLFDREVRELMAQGVRGWNDRMAAMLEEVAAVHPPREPVDIGQVAEMFGCVVDGGITLSKVLNDPLKLEAQVLAFRSYVRMLFSPAPATAAYPPADAWAPAYAIAAE